MKVTVKYDGVPYQLTTEARGHSITADAFDFKKNGGDTALTPHEHLLASLGECAAMTILMFAFAKKWPVERLNVTVTEGKIDDPDNEAKQIPHVVEKVDIPDGTLTEEQLTKLKEVGEKCPLKRWVQERKVIEVEVTQSKSS